MEVPKFRYMQDAERFLKQMNKEVDEERQLLKKHQQLLGASLSALRVTAATMVFDLSAQEPGEQRKAIKKLKHTIDPELKNIVVPKMDKLKSQYNMAEDFYNRLKTIEQAETQVQMSFHDRRGTEYEALMRQFTVLKTKVEDALRDCLQFLADIAQKHVPESFQKYVDMVAKLVSEHVIFREAQTFMYVSVDPEGNLVFTAYIMLQEVANDEGEVAPHLYISIQWVVGKEDNNVSIDLNHEYEVPNKLLGQGEIVGSVGEAAKAINTLLELENFNSALGIVPLALQLNVDPTSINMNMFQYRDVMSEFKIVDETMVFKFTKEVKNEEGLMTVAARLYKELKAMMKPKGVELKMSQPTPNPPYTLVFKIVRKAQHGEFNEYDFEWLRDKFGLNNTQLRKIADLLNSGHTEENKKKMEKEVTDLQKKLQKRYGVDESKMRKINNIINR